MSAHLQTISRFFIQKVCQVDSSLPYGRFFSPIICGILWTIRRLPSYLWGSAAARNGFLLFALIIWFLIHNIISFLLQVISGLIMEKPSVIQTRNEEVSRLLSQLIKGVTGRILLPLLKDRILFTFSPLLSNNFWIMRALIRSWESYLWSPFERTVIPERSK